MAVTLVQVRTAADVLPAWRNTPVAELLAAVNLGAVPGRPPAVLVSRCWEDLRPMPTAAMALCVTGPGGVLKRDPFVVSWAVAEAGIRAIAVVGHADCRLAGLRGRRETFVSALAADAGWERPAAEQHFDHWADLVEPADPAAAVLAETARLARRYPKLTVAPLLRLPDGSLAQVVATSAAP